jgi:hypothetical protein
MFGIVIGIVEKGRRHAGKGLPHILFDLAASYRCGSLCSLTWSSANITSCHRDLPVSSLPISRSQEELRASIVALPVNMHSN